MSADCNSATGVDSQPLRNRPLRPTSPGPSRIVARPSPWVGLLVACAVAGVLAACGEPTVTYEIKLAGDWAGNEGVFAACLANCDARNRGKGCKGDNLTIELGSNPCDVACSFLVAGAIDDGCPKEAIKLWNCEASLAWTCASAEADPVSAQAAQCAALTNGLAQCVAQGGSSDGPPLTLASACDARCKAEAAACSAAKPSCSADCQADSALDLPAACTKLAAIAVKCQSKSVLCSGDTPMYESCPEQIAAVEACRIKETPMSPGEALCAQGCAEVGKLPGCSEYATGECLKGCKYQAGMPAICKQLSDAYWTCAADPMTGSCSLVSGSWSGGCQAQKSALQACTAKCVGDQCSCVPAALSCSGSKVMKCSADGKTQGPIKDCGDYKANCQAGECVGGDICTDYNKKTCVGEVATFCSAVGLTVKEDCASVPGTKCMSGKCVVACTPGAVHCEGNGVYKCLADGLTNYKVETCGLVDKVCQTNVCIDGKCVDTPEPAGSKCLDFNKCNQAPACDGKGACVSQPGPACDDKTDCTTDSCDSAVGCKFVPNDQPCDDGNTCTSDNCLSGKGCESNATKPCLGVQFQDWCYEVIDDSSYLWGAAEMACKSAGGHLATIQSSTEQDMVEKAIVKGAGYAVPAWIGLTKGSSGYWNWVDGTAVGYNNWTFGYPTSYHNVGYVSSTGKWITTQSANTLGRAVCQRKTAPNCNDGNNCTVGDTCENSVCKAGGPFCDDNNPCTVDLCEASSATVCSTKPVVLGVSCDDAQVCTQGDACDGQGACAAAGAKNCDDSNPCTADSCVEPVGCAHVALQASITCGAGLACVGMTCQAAGSCGDGIVNNAGEVCDDKNTAGGDGCAGDCTLEPAKSCALLKASFPSLVSGMYAIDPDGPGPLPSAKLYCAMAEGWTLLASVFDTEGDDVPNLPSDVTAGWQQTGSGVWGPVSQVAPAGPEGGSAALGLDFVAAMAAWGTKNLRFCFVSKVGLDSVCVSSPFKLMLVGEPGGNPLLSPYSGNLLAWTYGRLSGLPASVNSFDLSKLKAGAGCVPVGPGQTYEFGTDCSGWQNGGMCEASGAGEKGVWCGRCDGACFSPAAADDSEIAATKDSGALVANPSASTWGFRIYAGP